jgi:hypothetical protein
MRKKHALGIVVKDRWPFTYATLNSVHYSDQNEDDFDLFIIDNGSDRNNLYQLKKWLSGGLLDFKNLICLSSPLPIPDVWNIFLSISQEYEYRTKLDNDIVFLGTPVIQWDAPIPKTKGELHYPKAEDYGTNPGAVQNASIVTGAHAMKGPRQSQESLHSCFLQHFEDYHVISNAEMVSLVPITPGASFPDTIQNLAQTQINGYSYLVGGCTSITKRCFKTLGYFDERLPRRIDLEYSQRALLAGLNIGYHDKYYVSHVGARTPTDSDGQSKRSIADNIIQKGRKKHCSSKWADIAGQIAQSLNENKIINLQ